MPPEGWKLPVIILLGIKAGLVTYLFYISKAPAYLSDDPRACVNCHVPHDHIFNTYYFKAKDGLRHATIFTLRKEPQVIFIKEEGKSVVLDNCISCHEHLLTDPWLQRVTDYYHSFPSERQ